MFSFERLKIFLSISYRFWDSTLGIQLWRVLSPLKLESPQFKKNTCVIFLTVLQAWRVWLKSASDRSRPFLASSFHLHSMAYAYHLTILLNLNAAGCLKLRVRCPPRVVSATANVTFRKYRLKCVDPALLALEGSSLIWSNQYYLNLLTLRSSGSSSWRTSFATVDSDSIG